uniref:Uncharacterized protein n=1 Tax=Sphaerodactylus townsendi TaxID=933632 RepID=A0ACB8FUA0_9SAUR
MPDVDVLLKVFESVASMKLKEVVPELITISSKACLYDSHGITGVSCEETMKFLDSAGDFIGIITKICTDLSIEFCHQAKDIDVFNTDL